jgi:outer membrane protein OmpA-like peptidoglycan-associated protein
MQSTSNVARILSILLVAGSLSGVVACSQAPKPKELNELERILKEPGANEVKEVAGAIKHYEESRKLRRAALDEWEDGNIDKARHYSIRGKISYRTAEAIARQHEAKKRFQKADEKVQKTNPKVQSLAKQRDKLREEVRELHRKVQKKQRARANKRREELQAQDETSKSQEQELEAQNRIREALDAKQKALEVNANEHAKGTFNRADNQLKSAQSLLASNPGSASSVAQSAKEAKAMFEKATREAKPGYKEQKAKENPMQRLSALKEKLSLQFGDAQVESIGQGVRVAVPSLFEQDATEPRAAKRSDLETIAEMANKFDEFSVNIAGFTRKGDPTENLSISQVRAKSVKSLLTDQGVSSGRISTEGNGQSQLRYDAPARNDRVEVTFRISN